MRGLAQPVILDPPATAAFAAMVGTSHAVAPWTLRTYEPAADPAWAPDARRHKVLSTSRLARQHDRSIRSFLSRAARTHAAARPVPVAVTRVFRDLSRLEDRLFLDTLFTTVDPVPGPQNRLTSQLSGLPSSPSTPVTDSNVEAPALGAVTRPAPAPEAAPTGSYDALDTGFPNSPPEAAATGGCAADALSTTAGATTTPSDPAPAVNPDRERTLTDPDSDNDARIPPGAGAAVDDRTAGDPEPEGTVATKPDGQVAAQAAEYLAQVELTKEILGVVSLDQESLANIATLLTRGRRDTESVDRVTRELAARQQRIADLEDEVAFHKELYSEEEFSRVVAEDERSRAEDEARWLRQQLREHGSYDSANASIPDDVRTRYPDSFEQLISRLPEIELRGVIFTGDPETARALDDVDGNSKLVRTAWESLLVLGDYVTARCCGDHEHGVQLYLEHTPSGYRAMSAKKHAQKESTSTMNQWGSERVMSVPVDVDAAEVASMEAHFKLGRVGMVSPRMHYLDDVTRTGKVYVGYIGPHLTTAATN